MTQIFDSRVLVVRSLTKEHTSIKVYTHQTFHAQKTKNTLDSIFFNVAPLGCFCYHLILQHVEFIFDGSKVYLYQNTYFNILSDLLGLQQTTPATS